MFSLLLFSLFLSRHSKDAFCIDDQSIIQYTFIKQDNTHNFLGIVNVNENGNAFNSYSDSFRTVFG